MSLKQILGTYSPLELKEFIKEHNKRVRKMVTEEVKEFRKKKLSELVIKAVGKKDDLIEKMVKTANKNDISNFKLIKNKGKMSQAQKDKLDLIQTKEAEEAAEDFYKDKITEKQLKKELMELKNERIRAEQPKLNVPKLLKFIKDKKEEKKEKPKMKIPKIIISEYIDEKKEKKQEVTKPVPKLPKKDFKIKLPKEEKKPEKKPQAKQPEKKPDPETDTEDEDFVLPSFFKNTPENIKKNIIKGVEKGDLPSSSFVLTTLYKTMRKIKNGVEKKDKDPEDRIDGLGRGIIADDTDKEHYKAVYGKKLPEKEIQKEFIKIASELMAGDKSDKDKVRKHINKASLEIQKALLKKDKEAYLVTVSGVNDKTGESRKRADEIDAAIAKDKAQMKKEFEAAKKEQDKETELVKKKIKEGEAVKKDVSRKKKK